MAATPVPTDEEILDWWECYAQGLSLAQIAFRFGRRAGTIKRHFVELGIALRIDDLDECERRIAAALARVDPSVYGHVAYARSMQHTKPVRKRIPQSKRQRRLDSLGGGVWTRVIRQDLKRAGLIP
jgi:hypothetical protein